MPVPGQFKRGQILATATIPLGRPGVDMQMRVTYDVAFDREGPAGGEKVLETLEGIARDVRNRVLPALRGFFPRT